MEITTGTQLATNLLISLGYGVVTVVAAAGTLYVLDHVLYRDIDFVAEIKRGNVAASVFYSALLGFVALVVTLSIN